jgi:molecular chaperone GrpE
VSQPTQEQAHQATPEPGAASNPGADTSAAHTAPTASGASADGAAPASAPAAALTPEERIAALEAELSHARDEFLRAKAETENVRRRAQDDIAKTHKYASESFAEALLPVKDSLEAALADTSGAFDTLKSGVELTLKQLSQAFEKGRVQELNPAGQKFDPHKHQAISMVDSELEANHVVGVLQKGYQIHERVLRPALVTVSKPKG